MENVQNIEFIIALVLGLFACFFGYKLKKVIFFIAWFLIGYTIMTKIMPYINDNAPMIAESELYQFLLPIAGGVLLSMFGFSIEKLCVALLAFFAVVAFAINQFGISGEVLAVAAIIGVFAGALATTMMKPATILVTAIAGGIVAADSIMKIFPGIPYAQYYYLIFLGITAVGAIFQFVNAKNA